MLGNVLWYSLMVSLAEQVSRDLLVVVVLLVIPKQSVEGVLGLEIHAGELEVENSGKNLRFLHGGIHFISLPQNGSKGLEIDGSVGDVSGMELPAELLESVVDELV